MIQILKMSWALLTKLLNWQRRYENATGNETPSQKLNKCNQKNQKNQKIARQCGTFVSVSDFTVFSNIYLRG